jgi:hypothetical protein
MKTNILRTGPAICASVLMMGALPSLADQAAMAAKPDKTWAGTVSAVNDTERTLEVKGLMLGKKFNLGMGCKYALLDKPAGDIGDLQPGQRVLVSYQDSHGVLVADSIKEEPLTCEGTVMAIDHTKHTVTVHHFWGDRTFQLPEECAVMLHGGKSGTLADIRAGDYVTVSYEKPDHTPTALEIARTGEIFTGEVTAIDMTDKTVKARAMYGSKTFHLADGCAIMINGQPTGRLNDLRLGERVTFTYNDIKGVDIVNRIGYVGVPEQTETTATQPPAPQAPVP